MNPVEKTPSESAGQLNTHSKWRTAALFFFIALACLQLLIVVFNHYNFRTFAYYYGVYNFAFYDFAHLRCSPVPVLFDGRNSTFMQDHFSLLLPLISPVYWLARFTTGTYTLLIIQWMAIVAGGWATFRLVERKTGHLLSATGAIILYFTLYSRFASYVADCNLAIIGSSLVPVFLYLFEYGRRWQLLTIFVLLVIIREDISLWLSFICLYLFIEHKRDRVRRRMAATLSIVSAAAFVIIMTLVIPALETDNVKFLLFNYSALGPNSAEALAFMITHPLEALRLLFVNHSDDPAQDGIKTWYFIVFGISGGVLLFWRPAMLLCFIPVAAKKMYNDDPIRWGIESYYGIETVSLLPVLIFVLIGGFSSGKLRNVLAVTVVLVSVLVTMFCFSRMDYMHSFTKIKFYKAWYWQRDQPVHSLHDALARVPEDAAVSATGRILPHVAFRRKIYYFPAVNDAQYLCVNTRGDAWPLGEDEFRHTIDSIMHSGAWAVEYMEENAAILRKK